MAERLDALIERWDAGGEPPTLAEFLPDGPGAVRRLALIELIKVDLEYRWASARPRRIEDYLADFPELALPSGVPCDLIFEEFQVRLRAGDGVTADEYTDRFPAQASEIARLFRGDPNRRQTGCPQDIEAGRQLDDFDLLAVAGEGHSHACSWPVNGR